MPKTKGLKIEKIRHSLAHILAYAVQRLYPKVKFGIGPAIENGFYYDFDFGSKKINQEDLFKIEKEMRKIILNGVSFKKKIVSRKEAEEIFKDQPYKLSLLKNLKGKKVSLYQSGHFLDLCKGPHIKSTKEINPDAFKLTKIAGAYWQGSEKNPMLTRIYGVAFSKPEELSEYLKFQEEVEKRDHRVLGQKLELFLFDQEVGAGLPLWQPKGEILRRIIQDHLYQELKKENYQWVVTPHIGNLKLWQTSGHWQLYRENIYSPIEIDEEKYLLKPMNCPFHVKIYQSKIRSYRDLPIKYAEFGTVYRYERSGTLHGLTRVRGFTQDDAHIWCRQDQLSTEVEKLLRHGLKILKKFGFKNFEVYLSTRPEKFAGTLQGWQKATKILKDVLKKLKINYQIDPGGGVFYGPKIDIKIKDSLNREWQCTTIQIDFNLPARFGIYFINKKGEREVPYMIHRALLGSLERFIGVLLEHYAGALPFWLSPEQVWLLPVSLKQEKYAKEINLLLQEKGVRSCLIRAEETLSKRIREGEIQKIPYLLIIGEKEEKKKKVSLRERGKGDLGQIKLTDFFKKVSQETNK